MKRLYTFDGLWLDSENLNYEVDAKTDSLKKRIKAVLNSDAIPDGSGSIIGHPGDTALEVSSGTVGFINVAAGEAIDKNGEYIYVPEDPSDLEDEYAPSRRDRENIALTDLGISGANTWYFGIEYEEGSGCIKSNREGETFATRYYDRYKWVASSGSLTSPQITLAKITTDASGVITNLEDCRTDQWLSCQVNAANVYIVDSPVDAITTLEEHVNATGSATPSAANPHGIDVTGNFDGRCS